MIAGSPYVLLLCNFLVALQKHCTVHVTFSHKHSAYKCYCKKKKTEIILINKESQHVTATPSLPFVSPPLSFPICNDSAVGAHRQKCVETGYVSHYKASNWKEYCIFSLFNDPKKEKQDTMFGFYKKYRKITLSPDDSL